jgi:hypothetical protein
VLGASVLRCAEAAKYIRPLPPELIEKIDHVIGSR